MEINSVGTDLFYAEGETDERTDRRDETNTRFSKFCESA